MHDLVIKNATVVDGSGEPAFPGDVVVDAGRITAVHRNGGGPTTGRRLIQAGGDMLTPGFVDIHTHYDGQVCWDKQLTPSCWHGVTSVVMGNCGVGFAPVQAGTEADLVSLMESVEDIPGTALSEGIPWGWESFGQYLDSIDSHYSMDVGAQLPHVALRHYVMGERSYEDANAADIRQMEVLAREAMCAGALGISTSRYYGHRDKNGNKVPGTHASAAEMVALGRAFEGLPYGTLQIISDYINEPEEQAWVEQICRHSHRPVIFSVVHSYRKAFELADRMQGQGLIVKPMVGARPPSILLMLDGTINPLRPYPAYADIAHLPLDQQRKMLLDSEFRRRIVEDEPRIPTDADTATIALDHQQQYIMDDSLSYEPGPEDSIAALAAAGGVHPREVMMDLLAAGKPILVLFGGYKGDLEPQRKAMEDSRTVFGLSDAGAHCSVLADASVPTYLLSYFSRDRKKGPKLSPEFVINKICRNTAQLYGMHDRGVIAPGYKADFNLIDYPRLALHYPEMVYDLPAGGRRLIQKASGYRFTIKAGEVTYENGEHTGALPGRLLRGAELAAAVAKHAPGG